MANQQRLADNTSRYAAGTSRLRMPKAPMHSRQLARPRSPAWMLDKYAIVPILACVFALIVSPLFGLFNPPDQQTMLNGSGANLDNRIFWPVMAAISILLAIHNSSRLAKLTWPPHVICLLVYLSFAGASVLWAFSPQSSFVRFVQQAMIITSIVLPAMLAARSADIIHGTFLCFAFALVLNLFFVLGGSVDIGNCSVTQFCYEGYFAGKNYLGECAAAAFLLSLHEIAYRGWRRVLGVIFTTLAVSLIYLSDCKTALGLVIISPFLAQLTLILRKITRVSPAIILLLIPFFYEVALRVLHIDLIQRMAYIIYNDSSLTGRTIIWDFAQYEIGGRPLLGWGYQSFWLVPGSPSLEAPGWIKRMPNAHNGYYDTTLEMGYIGLSVLYGFIITTLHAVGRVADCNPARARMLLSLALFFIMWNYFESLWMRGFEFLWVVFVIAAAEIGRYWQRFPLRKAYKSKALRPGNYGRSGT